MTCGVRIEKTFTLEGSVLKGGSPFIFLNHCIPELLLVRFKSRNSIHGENVSHKTHAGRSRSAPFPEGNTSGLRPFITKASTMFFKSETGATKIGSSQEHGLGYAPRNQEKYRLG